MSEETNVILNIVYMICFILFLEMAFPNRELPKVKWWYTRATVINIAQVCVAILAGYTWNKWMYGYSVFNLSELYSPIVSGFIAYFSNTFITYWWHRLRHKNRYLWRVLHQLHHSPKRIEILTSFYKHPIEMMTNSIIGSSVAYLILGINFEAGAYCIIFAAFGEVFSHSNLKTPYWLGYFYQRPEMHRVHHKRGFHYCNFSDFPIWDQLFGTFENPKNLQFEQGFKDDLENKFFKILRFIDVNPKQKVLLKKVERSNKE
jgi:sterol desaturase/sphingolipid hydroxylase (fatty acid hydroxylase superfamily)